MKTNEELLQIINALKKENEKLKEMHKSDQKIIDEQKTEIYETNKKLEQALLIIQNYEEKYNIERTRIFIPKTEKLDEIVINETEEIVKQARKSNKGKKYRKKKIDYEKLVSEIRYINPEEEVCPKCGEKLINVSEKIRYLVTVNPASMKVIKLVKISKKCPHCNKEDNKIYYPIANESLTGSILSPSLAAYVAYHKYELGIPFEHLARHITNNVGFEISKQNLANYMAKIADVLEPIYNRMLTDMLNNESKVIHSDETTLVVTKKDEENKDRKKSYVYVYTNSFYEEKRIRIYDFHESRSIDKTAKWLENYKGVIVCDGYTGYDSLKKNNDNILLQRCWVHVRRKFSDIVKNIKEKDRVNSRAYKILKEIQKLFQLESKYKKEKISPSEIVKRRIEEVPIIQKSIKTLLDESNPLKGSALEGAIEYTKGCWNDLFTFINNGYVEISNNIAEQAVKPFVIQRKVFQTSGSYAGAKYTSKLFSIVQTCKINNVNVERYFNYALENINNENIEDILPYSKKTREKLK